MAKNVNRDALDVVCNGVRDCGGVAGVYDSDSAWDRRVMIPASKPSGTSTSDGAVTTYFGYS